MLPARCCVLLACTLAATPGIAQAERKMKLMAPVVVGQTGSVVIEHSPSLAGNLFAMAICSPTYPGSLTLSVPGVIQGVLRLDPFANGLVGTGILDASGRSPAFAIPVPNLPWLVGWSLDVQGADIDAAGLVTLTRNDLELTVAAAPPASLKMVAIPPGTFLMGSTTVGGVSAPVHQVTITRPFWIGKYEVSQSEFAALMGYNPSSYQGAGFPNPAERPVEWVYRQAATTYCQLLSLQESLAGRLPSGYVYRLPTEAEWEYCCRAGSTTDWHVGNTLGCADANYLGCVGQPSLSGLNPPNAWGLFDMHGNVEEWCLDVWDGVSTYSSAAVADPCVTTGGLGWVRRGGHFLSSAIECSSGFRSTGVGPAGSPWIGFRVVCAPADVVVPPAVNQNNMVAISAGTFQMGSPLGGPQALPLHPVTISQAFWIGKFEVTQAEFLAVMGYSSAWFVGANRPMESVSWSAAVAYCDALTSIEAAAGRLPAGYEYRLPTEAEWEYCCRAGTTTDWYVGSSLACTDANFCYASSPTAPVGSYASNPWGLHDMHGNVGEWCLDSWTNAPNYPAGLVADPLVSVGAYRVMRGGAVGYPAALCSSGYRNAGDPFSTVAPQVGFRIVCGPIR